MKSLKCAIFTGDLITVDIESDFQRGLPVFKVAGLAGSAVKESEDRIKSALMALNFTFPPQRIVFNLAPSDIPKNSTLFDLPMAILIALQKEKFEQDFFVFGELGLNGAVKSTNSLFSVLLFLSQKLPHAKVLLPAQIALKAASIPNLEIYAVNSLEDAIRFFREPEFAANCQIQGTHPIFQNTLEINGQIYVPNFNYELDFYDIKGQIRAKRATLIAACGMHNILYEGSPGSGKSMCAKRLRYILPPQSLDEILLSTAYESLNNKDVDFSVLRPFRSPHHTSTRSSIFGGGSANSAKIGEVALANGGELFFDELPHFGKPILESLREPLEDNKILISRVNSKTEYQTKFLFAAAMNPCPCGNLFSQNLSCKCSEIEIKRYKNTISAPILDRIDLYVAMDEVKAEDKPTCSSKELYSDVLRVFRAQKMRGQSELNGKLSDAEIKRVCVMENDAQSLLDSAVARFNLSQRGINKTLKIARTIADLKEHENIDKSDISEALSFRIRSF